ncbi:MAG: hypothetical protein ACLTMP_14170 [Eggerthella lenta]
MAEERLGLTLAYHTYTAENYQDKTYDEVCLERARNNSDDLYLLNTDTIVTSGRRGTSPTCRGFPAPRTCGRWCARPTRSTASSWPFPKRWWPTACS